MTLTIYSLKNRLTGIFERPFAEIYDSKEYPELLTQSLSAAPVEALQKHKEYDVYCLGSFDSKSGECLVAAPEFVMSLEGICLNFIAKKESENVREERVDRVESV